MNESDVVAAEMAELVQSWPGVPFVSLEPATEDDILAAERELGIGFPKSYRAFLRAFGAGTMHYYEIFGLPGDRLWGNVVMMNQLSSRKMPPHFLKFIDSVGALDYYLDTSQMNSDGECPVVVFGPDENGEIVADSFLDFLRKVNDGLL